MQERLKRMGRGIISAVRGQLSAGKKRPIFDAVFYLRRYPDLASSIDTALGAKAHYVRHGQAEGRFGSRGEEEASDYERYLTPSAEFDLIAYRLLNTDLGDVFTQDREYILHFIRHGRDEKRRATFANDRGCGRTAPWAHLFSVSQFSAWASDWMPPPDTRAEALDMFERVGIEILAPIRFDFIFDPGFYRQHYQLGNRIADVALYREWLDRGLPDGKSPNEAHLMRPYIGGLKFPECFEWERYAASRELSTVQGRAAVLIHLLENEKNWDTARRFMHGLGGGYVAAFVEFALRHNRPKIASQLLAAWSEELSEANPNYLSLKGDVYSATRRSSDAKGAWKLALANGSRDFGTLQKLARAEIASKNFAGLAEILSQQRSNFAGFSDFDHLVVELVDVWFGSIQADARAMIVEGVDTVAMSESVCASLSKISETIIALESSPGHIGYHADGPVVFLGNENLRQCTHYRIEQKQEVFHRAGVEFKRHALDDINGFITNLIGAQSAVFYRVPATPAVIRAILTARAMGIPTWYEIDDLLFSPNFYPGSYEGYSGSISPEEYHGLQLGVPLFRFALSLCDRAIASTQALLEHMLPLVRRCDGFVLRNGLDSRNTRIVAAGGGMRDWAPGRVRIFYGSGTLAHGRDFSEILAPALNRLMQVRLNVDLVIVGHVPNVACLSEFSGRVVRLPIVEDINAYWDILATCSISTAVLGSGAAEDCKSEIKWLEAAAGAIPSVVSATSTFIDIVRNGLDGLVARSVEEWYSSLLSMVDDEGFRHRIGSSARERALRDYDLPRQSEVVASKFVSKSVGSNGLMGKRQSDRARVMISNVFFHPQSIGGATRVVEQNVADMIEENQNIDLSVFCSDLKFGNSWGMRTTRFGDVPVFRVSIPEYLSVDKRAFDERVLPAFCKALDTFEPDIVHFHCIQRLTAAVAEECLRRSIPYIITIHDGWWLSENQFLVDTDGILRVPERDILRGRDVRHFSPDLARRRLLAPILLGAACITTVSESFAAIYREAGFSAIRVLENGVPSLPYDTNASENWGAVRLSHIGGRSSHKGADIVEAALRLGNYRNLSLTMVDGSLAPGSFVETQWGQSQVKLIAPVPQLEVASLYRGTDVLLCPSRWPESYGLVAREARNFGIWTIASNLGAIGAEILEGENGFLVDTSGRSGLDGVLAIVDAAPNNFRRGSARRVSSVRMAREQAVEFAQLYREVLSKDHVPPRGVGPAA